MHSSTGSGGTPDVLGVIRAGLVFNLKSAVGDAEIRRREAEMHFRVRSRLERNNRVHVLGCPDVMAVPIVTFMVEHRATGRFLHWNFIARLLSDLFGLQVRGGCLCAGPYGQYLLQMSGDEQSRMSRAMAVAELARPGYVRVSLNYYWSDSKVDFVADALDFVGTHGWKFLADYTYTIATGEWVHRTGPQIARSLSNVTYAKGQMAYPISELRACAPGLPKTIEAAHAAGDVALAKLASQCDFGDPPVAPIIDELGVRWFVLPSDVRADARDGYTGESVEEPQHANRSGRCKLVSKRQTSSVIEAHPSSNTASKALVACMKPKQGCR
jgi:hypothetical protein